MTSSSKTAVIASTRAERAAHERILARLRDHAVEVRRQMDYLAHHEAHHVYQMFQRRTPLGQVPAEG